jgi:hypothetical protein
MNQIVVTRTSLGVTSLGVTFVIALVAIALAGRRRREGIVVRSVATNPRLPHCGSQCTADFIRWVRTAPLSKNPGSKIFHGLQPGCQGCSMAFKTANNGKTIMTDGFLERQAGGSIVVRGKFGANGGFAPLTCSTPADCVGKVQLALGKYLNKGSKPLQKSNVARFAPNDPPQYVRLQEPSAVGEGILDVYTFLQKFRNKMMTLTNPSFKPIGSRGPGYADAVRKSGKTYCKAGTVEEGYAIPEFGGCVPKFLKTFVDNAFAVVRPRPGTPIAKGFVWEDVDRQYIVIRHRRSTGVNAKAFAAWQQQRRQRRQNPEDEDAFETYMIHLELRQMMQIQQFYQRANDAMSVAIRSLTKMPTAKRSAIQQYIKKISGYPGGPAMVHQAPNGIGYQGVGSTTGIGMVLVCGDKNVDNTDLFGSCGGDMHGLIKTVIHEYTHFLSNGIPDINGIDVVQAHNYGFWSFMRFVELVLVAANILDHDWRMNAQNASAKKYAGYDPFYQRDWVKIKRDVLAYGGSAEDMQTGAGYETGSSKGWRFIVWDDAWESVRGEFADRTILNTFKALFRGKDQDPAHDADD